MLGEEKTLTQKSRVKAVDGEIPSYLISCVPRSTAADAWTSFPLPELTRVKKRVGSTGTELSPTKSPGNTRKTYILLLRLFLAAKYF